MVLASLISSLASSLFIHETYAFAWSSVPEGKIQRDLSLAGMRRDMICHLLLGVGFVQLFDSAHPCIPKNIYLGSR